MNSTGGTNFATKKNRSLLFKEETEHNKPRNKKMYTSPPGDRFSDLIMCRRFNIWVLEIGIRPRSSQVTQWLKWGNVRPHRTTTKMLHIKISRRTLPYFPLLINLAPLPPSGRTKKKRGRDQSNRAGKKAGSVKQAGGNGWGEHRGGMGKSPQG